MIQRPQTLFFFLAAILVVFATFSPISSYSPESTANNDLNARMVVSPSNLTFKMDYSEEMGRSKERHEKSLEKFNKEIDERLDENKLAYLFLIGLVGMLSLAAVIVLIALMYKKRKAQIRLGFIVIFIMVATSAGMYVGAGIGMEILAEMEFIPRRFAEYNWEISYNYGSFLLPIAAILMFVGVFLVRKDEDLIRSVDRIR